MSSVFLFRLGMNALSADFDEVKWRGFAFPRSHSQLALSLWLEMDTSSSLLIKLMF